MPHIPLSIILLLRYSVIRSSMNTRLLSYLFALSLFLSIPSFVRIPQILPFLDPEVRKVAPIMLSDLRDRGLWLVNVDLKNVTEDENTLCYIWEHRYTRRTGADAPEPL